MKPIYEYTIHKTEANSDALFEEAVRLFLEQSEDKNLIIF